MPASRIGRRGATASRAQRRFLAYARLPWPREALREHRHAQAELYFILSGEGDVVVDGGRRPVRAGTAIFFPSHARHGIANTGSAELRYIYVFAADSFADIAYVFET